MHRLDPTMPMAVPQSGTFSGNPASMAAGTEALRLLTPEEISRLNALGDIARASIGPRIRSTGWEIRGHGSLLRPYPVAAGAAVGAAQQRLWWSAYERGVLLTPANLASLSTPMSERVVLDLADRLADAITATPVDAI